MPGFKYPVGGLSNIAGQGPSAGGTNLFYSFGIFKNILSVQFTLASASHNIESINVPTPNELFLYEADGTNDDYRLSRWQMSKNYDFANAFLKDRVWFSFGDGSSNHNGKVIVKNDGTNIVRCHDGGYIEHSTMSNFDITSISIQNYWNWNHPQTFGNYGAYCGVSNDGKKLIRSSYIRDSTEDDGDSDLYLWEFPSAWSFQKSDATSTKLFDYDESITDYAAGHDIKGFAHNNDGTNFVITANVGGSDYLIRPSFFAAKFPYDFNNLEPNVGFEQAFGFYPAVNGAEFDNVVSGFGGSKLDGITAAYNSSNPPTIHFGFLK